ncbi:MAG TPA: D-TA family PLP-dependent enzyme [Limnochordia bacterium]|nr:D-TA family PLP-dependent enzyme [Limnochordia bacterium]
MRIDALETPVVLIDIDKVEANLKRWQDYCNKHRLANRPHIKTHKVVELARRQLELGAAGLTCQKIGEAEVMADAGFDDLFLPYNILGEAKLRRVIDLARRVRLSLTCDSVQVAEGLSRAAAAAGLTLNVLVECESGQRRCGVQTPEAACALAQRIDQLPGLAFGGLMTYPSSAAAAAFVRETLALLAGSGLKARVVSGGGTPAMWHAHDWPEFTEHRAGTYVYHDRYTVKHGAATFDDCALRVLTTVVSRPTPERAVLDAGSKTLTSDLIGLEGHGLIVGAPQAQIVRLSEEHGVVESQDGPLPFAIGDRVEVIPNHACPVSNLFDQVVVRSGDEVMNTWQVAARGRVQ